MKKKELSCKIDNRTLKTNCATYDLRIENAKVRKGNFVMCMEDALPFRSQKEACDYYGINQATMSLHLNKKTKCCKVGKGEEVRELHFFSIENTAPEVSIALMEIKQHSVSKEDAARLRKENDDLKEELQKKDFIIQNYKAKLDNISKALAG